jgi:hypothetical protein
MEKAQQFLDGRPFVGKTVSLVDFVKQMNQAMHADAPACYTVSQNIKNDYSTTRYMERPE